MPRAFLSYLPLLAFLVSYFAYDFRLATLVLLISASLVTLIGRVVYKSWEKIELVTLAVALVSGGLTLALDDPLYLQLKPSLVYGGLSLGFALSALVGKPLTKAMMGTKLTMTDANWRQLAWRIAAIFAVPLLVNEWARTSLSLDDWVRVKVIVLPALVLVGFIAQSRFLYRSMQEHTTQEKNSTL